MKVRFVYSYEDVQTVFRQGRVYDIPEATAAKMIKDGFAVDVSEPATATVGPEENAMARPLASHTAQARRRKQKRGSNSGSS